MEGPGARRYRSLPRWAAGLPVLLAALLAGCTAAPAPAPTGTATVSPGGARHIAWIEIPPAGPAPSVAPSAFAPLRATATGPASAPAGGEYRYTVSLTNTGGTAVTMAGHACPGYTQSLGDRVVSRYQLDCVDAGGVVLAGATLLFDMRLSLAGTTSGTSVTWRWALDGGPVATGTLALT